MFTSIAARRRNADPEPYVLLDGTRSATDPVDVGNPDHWVVDDLGHLLHLAHLADYAPRAEYSPALHNPVNPILDAMRDTWDDPWGSAMAWAFPCATVLDYLGADVPAAAGYRPSAWGSASDLVSDDYETAQVVDLLGLGVVDSSDGNGPVITLHDRDGLDPQTVADAVAYAGHSLAVLNRYLDAARAAGLDY